MAQGDPRSVVHVAEGRKAFTLVELMIVIAMMALVLSMFLPAIRHAREQAEQTVCHDRLRQLQTANAQVTQQRGRIPLVRPLAFPVLTDWPGDPLPGVLRGKLPIEADAYHCPGDLGELFTVTGMSYYFNAPLGGKTPPDLSGTQYRTLPPASVPVLWDADAHRFKSTIGPIDVPRFHGSRHAAFLDGSVGSVTREHSPME